MPFRASFDCLWCGTTHTCRSSDDLEGWAHLCPDCVGKAGDNGFLRYRLRQALTERSGGSPLEALATTIGAAPAPRAPDMAAYHEARAPEYDDWYLRRGRYSRGAIHDTAWNAELDTAGRWLDAQPISGEIVELAAGTGWWSPLLASKGELSMYDAVAAPLERARERLVAHDLRAHLHVRDAWAEPDRKVDAVFAGFWLSHVERERLPDFLGIVHRWLKPGGRFAFIDSLADPASGAADHPSPEDEQAIRRLQDGRDFSIFNGYYEPREFVEALGDAGFEDAAVTTTGRFFVLGSAQAP